MSEKNNDNQNMAKQSDFETLESEFREKGLDVSALLEMGQDIDVDDGSHMPVKQKQIRKISEELNDYSWDFEIYTDTRKILPGLVVYVIEQIAPTEKTPYVKYKPAARIITEIQDNGVNNGTLFFTYVHEIKAPAPTYNAGNLKSREVVSHPEIIYSPLTKAHAEYVCNLLNLQSKQEYMKSIKNAKRQNLNQR